MKMIQPYRIVHKNTPQQGSILVLTLVISVMIMILGTNVAQIIVAQQSSFKQQATADTALVAADTGVKAAIAQLNKNSGWTDFGGSPTLTEQAFDSTSTYTVKVTPIDDDFKRIDATGKTYRDTTKTVVVNTKKLQVVVAAKKNPVSESIVIGPGGLEMHPNSFIPNNDVNVRGPLTMHPGSRIGTNAVGGGVNVTLANIGCGAPPAEWPVSCALTEPLSMPSGGANIYGIVCANGQASSAGITNPDTGVSGLDTSCKPRTVEAPRFDKQSFINDTITTPAPGSPSSNFQCIPTGSFFQQNNYRSNTQIINVPPGTRIADTLMTSAADPGGSNPSQTQQNVQDSFGRLYNSPDYGQGMRNGAKCEYRFSGNVYIDGDLYIDSATRLRVADDVELEDAPVIVINGRLRIRSGDVGTNGLAPANNIGTPMYIISFNSVDAGCSRSDIEPNQNVQGCVVSGGGLSYQEAYDSARVDPLSGPPPCTIAPCGPYDMSGIALYYYFAEMTTVNQGNLNYQIYALGAQGLAVPPGTNFTTTAPNGPFANILTTVRWWPVDYKQVYN